VTLTEVQIATLLGALQVGADMALAAKTIGISRRTLYDCRAADESLKERIDEAKACADEVVIKSLYTKATKDKDVTAMIFWLKNRQPLDWRDRRELNIEGPIVPDVTSPEVRDRRLTELLVAAMTRRTQTEGMLVETQAQGILVSTQALELERTSYARDLGSDS